MEMDLNVDIGEGFPFDAQLLLWVSSASIACGGHAGDLATMARTVDHCLARGVRIGAHPGYPDRENFGRSPLALGEAALFDSLCGQLADLDRICRERSTRLEYVKPHGALYSQAAAETRLATLLCRAIKEVVPHAALMGLAGTPLLELAGEGELGVIREGFLDRRYLHGGALVPRHTPGALLTEETAVRAQLSLIARQQRVEAFDGRLHPVKVDSLCLHGDTDNALARAQMVHNHLKKLGFSLPQY
ncbi:5-oxoprolinase subunit PxpA [Ferrimonas sediminicola]|uniref:5-oxoprolinase subunit PxpA n=1 Tax=Ferrimonas sediminicola TaxID=2569538 RepID=A0A4U1BI69_9GAMM|nr:5-oxoprolinase subunit PxpA [Ferrimonas sediminicola]TKB50476.1 5-oxoprolinase subunit PxpA [Ferrimonas sediminicola]